MARDEWVCELPHKRGDGFCDPSNNYDHCGFDGGDCCNNNNEGWDQRCEVPWYQGVSYKLFQIVKYHGISISPFNHPLKQCVCKEEIGRGDWVCELPHKRGDGFCDPDNNYDHCGFDEGDCCDNDNEGWDKRCEVPWYQGVRKSSFRSHY